MVCQGSCWGNDHDAKNNPPVCAPLASGGNNEMGSSAPEREASGGSMGTNIMGPSAVSTIREPAGSPCRRKQCPDLPYSLM